MSYYALALPIGYLLGVGFNLGVIGFWWGLCLALFLSACFLCTFLLKTNWQEEVEKCQQRILNGEA
jgi:MATE family multidrug resistance protein